MFGLRFLPGKLQPNQSSRGQAVSTSSLQLYLAYGLGDAGTGLAATVLGFYLFPFFTEIAGLPAAFAGTVLMVIKVWDALTDPCIGWLSDRTRTRWGSRLPWIAGAAVPLGLCFAAIWWVPSGHEDHRFAYYSIVAVLLMTAYTAINLPYAALATELSSDTTVRTRLNATRFTGSLTAGFLGLLLAFRCVGHGASGYIQMGLLGGGLIVIASLGCACGLLPSVNQCSHPAQHPGMLMLQLRRMVANQRFRMVLGLYLLLWYALQLMQTVSLVFLRVVLHLQDNWALAMPMLFQLSAIFGLWFWGLLAQRYGRIMALRRGVALWGLALLLALLLPPLPTGGTGFAAAGEMITLIGLVLTILLLGLGGSTAFLIPWSLLPDAIDADPDRPAGFYTAWMVLVQKLGIGFGIFVLGLLLQFSGYIAENGSQQPAAAITMIRLSISLIPGVLLVLGLIVMRHWPRRQERAQLVA